MFGHNITSFALQSDVCLATIPKTLYTQYYLVPSHVCLATILPRPLSRLFGHKITSFPSHVCLATILPRSLICLFAHDFYRVPLHVSFATILPSFLRVFVWPRELVCLSASPIHRYLTLIFDPIVSSPNLFNNPRPLPPSLPPVKKTTQQNNRRREVQ